MNQQRGHVKPRQDRQDIFSITDAIARMKSKPGEAVEIAKTHLIEIKGWYDPTDVKQPYTVCYRSPDGEASISGTELLIKTFLTHPLKMAARTALFLENCNSQVNAVDNLGICPHCGSAHTRHAGHTSPASTIHREKTLQYQCLDCEKYFLAVYYQARRKYPADIKERCLQLFREGTPAREIERLTAVDHSTIYWWIRQEEEQADRLAASEAGLPYSPKARVRNKRKKGKHGKTTTRTRNN